MKVKRTVGMFGREICELLSGENEIVISSDDRQVTIPYAGMTEVSVTCHPERASRFKFTASNEDYEFIIENDDDSKKLVEELKSCLDTDMLIDFKLG